MSPAPSPMTEWIATTADFNNETRIWEYRDLKLPQEYKWMLELRHGITTVLAFTSNDEWRTVGEIVALIQVYERQVDIVRPTDGIRHEVEEQLQILQEYGFVKSRRSFSNDEVS